MEGRGSEDSATSSNQSSLIEHQPTAPVYIRGTNISLDDVICAINSNLRKYHGQAPSGEEPPVWVGADSIHRPPYNQTHTLNGSYEPARDQDYGVVGSCWQRSTHRTTITQTHGSDQSAMPYSLYRTRRNLKPSYFITMNTKKQPHKMRA